MNRKGKILFNLIKKFFFKLEMRKVITFVFFTIFSLNASAYSFKIRAREHYEFHKIKDQKDSVEYRGLTNTINLWWERPYDSYLGFSFSPILSSLNEVETNSVFGKKITQQNIGLEYKKFPQMYFKQLFLRAGFGYSRLGVNKGDKSNFYGHYYYFGMGYEVAFTNHGLALELAYRRADYNDAVSIESFTPSIGFHFYGVL